MRQRTRFQGLKTAAQLPHGRRTRAPEPAGCPRSAPSRWVDVRRMSSLERATTGLLRVDCDCGSALVGSAHAPNPAAAADAERSAGTREVDPNGCVLAQVWNVARCLWRTVTRCLQEFTIGRLAIVIYAGRCSPARTTHSLVVAAPGKLSIRTRRLVGAPIGSATSTPHALHATAPRARFSLVPFGRGTAGAARRFRAPIASVRNSSTR